MGKVPVHYRKAAAVDARNYKDYAGQYEWRSLDDVEITSVKDGRLWTQTGNESSEDMLPMGGDAFSLKGELGTNTSSATCKGA